MNARVIVVLAGIAGALGILIGAFGAHALPSVLPDLEAEAFAEREAWLETGVTYHMYHAVALLAVGLLGHRDDRRFSGAAIPWIAGILLFSGSLYAMTVSGVRVLGAVVPLGGISFVVGWVMVVISALKR